MTAFRGPSTGDLSIRDGVVGGEAEFINPPRYPLNCDATIDTPLDKVQPQFVGIARQTWQTVLTVALPYARSIGGMPGEVEILPGLSGPLNAEEREALRQLLAEEGYPV